MQIIQTKNPNVVAAYNKFKNKNFTAPAVFIG